MSKLKKGRKQIIKKRQNHDIEGNYMAYGSTPGVAYNNLRKKIYIQSDRKGYISDEEFKGKYGNNVSKQFFNRYGGSFDLTFYKDGSPKIYVIKGSVTQKGKRWVAKAEVLSGKSLLFDRIKM
jgi:hypothetical protein